jgi:hypothetical protein
MHHGGAAWYGFRTLPRTHAAVASPSADQSQEDNHRRGRGGRSGAGRRDAEAQRARALQRVAAVDGRPLRHLGLAAPAPARSGLRRAQHRLRTWGHRHRPALRAPLRRLDRRRLRPPGAPRPVSPPALRGIRAAARPCRVGRTDESSAHRRRVQPGHHRVLHVVDRGGSGRTPQRGPGVRGPGAHALGRQRAADPSGAVPGLHAPEHATTRSPGADRHRHRHGGTAERRLLLGDVQHGLWAAHIPTR